MDKKTEKAQIAFDYILELFQDHPDANIFTCDDRVYIDFGKTVFFEGTRFEGTGPTHYIALSKTGTAFKLRIKSIHSKKFQNVAIWPLHRLKRKLERILKVSF